MQLFFKEETNIYHTMFSRESKKSITGMQALNEFVERIHDAIAKSDDIYEIQRSIRLLSIFGDILETFNRNIELLVSSIDEKIFNDVMATSPNAVCLRVKDWIADVSSYQIGDKFKGFVSYVVDADTLLCFIRDLNKNDSIDCKPSVDSAFKGVPHYGEMFALQLNEKYFRAIRVNTEALNTSIRVRLIDIGETICVSPNVYKYTLSEDAKRRRPMAMLCRVEKIDDKMVNSLNGINKKTFEVNIKNICVNMLEVDLKSEAENGHESMNESLQQSIIQYLECDVDDEEEIVVENEEQPTFPLNGRHTNPFLNVSATKENDEIATNPHDQVTITYGHQMSEINSSVSVQKLAPVRPPPPLPPVPPRVRTKEIGRIQISLSKDVIRRREKEHENGIQENNDINVNGNIEREVLSPEKNEQKFNGAHPKMTNSRKENNIFKTHPVRELLPIPLRGEEVAVTPTHIVNAEYLFVQYNEWYARFEEFQFGTLQKVQPNPLSYIPKPGDVVIAKYNDGYIYRGRVEKIEQHNATIFYVDYGNTECVDYDGLFEWDPICNTLPFQAVSCRLPGIRSFPYTSTEEIYEFIRYNYMNKMCKAVVLDYIENTLYVNLKSTYGREIVDEINANLFPECIV